MSNMESPNVVIVGGPNGSGKSTAAPALLRDCLGITAFVNADVIAQGLSGFGAEHVALQAGRIMLDRLKELAGEKADFAFETTLASRTFAPFLDCICQSSTPGGCSTTRTAKATI